jgi:hypothetical protein
MEGIVCRFEFWGLIGHTFGSGRVFFFFEVRFESGEWLKVELPSSWQH